VEGYHPPPWPRFRRPPNKSTAIDTFFLSVIGLRQLRSGSASRCCPANATFHGPLFRGCSYFFMFRPPSLLASRVAPTAASSLAGQLRRLHPSRTCIVAFARIGYTIRPTRQLAERGLSPRKIHGIVDCSSQCKSSLHELPNRRGNTKGYKWMVAKAQNLLESIYASAAQVDRASAF
jgi:hypothetical protein